MLYLLDTNAISDLMEDRGQIRGRVGRISPADRVITCTIVRGEILYGLGRIPDGKRKQGLQQQADDIFLVIGIEPVGPDAAEHYAHAKIARQRIGVAMDENDLWVAATALALNAVLVSRDSDFRNVAGLLVEDWTV